MCDPLTAATIIATVGTGVYSANKAASAQSSANDQATKAATAAADQSDQAFNKANGKQPNVQGLMSENQMAAKGGTSGTMLTGPQGVDPKTLLLGKTTLLGG